MAGASKEQARWYYRLTDRGSDARMPWNQQQRWYDSGWEGTFERHGINAGVLLLCVTRLAEVEVALNPTVFWCQASSSNAAHWLAQVC